MITPKITQGFLCAHCSKCTYLGIESKVERLDRFCRLRNNTFSISQSNPALKINSTPSLSNGNNSSIDDEEENFSISKKITNAIERKKAIKSLPPKNVNLTTALIKQINHPPPTEKYCDKFENLLGASCADFARKKTHVNFDIAVQALYYKIKRTK